MKLRKNNTSLVYYNGSIWENKHGSCSVVGQTTTRTGKTQEAGRYCLVRIKYSKDTTIVEAKMEELQDCIDDIENKGKLS